MGINWRPPRPLRPDGCCCEKVLRELGDLRKAVTKLDHQTTTLNAALPAIRGALCRIETTLKENAVSEQSDIDTLTAQVQATDADVVSLTAQVAAGQAALDTAIQNLETQVANGQAPDLSQLKAAAAVLAGDQPNLDAAVAALAADPNATP